MIAWFRNLPFFVVLLFAAAAAMMVPAAYGAVAEDFHTARIFFYAGLLTAVGAMLIGIATQAHPHPPSERTHLIALVASYLILPLVLAVPMEQAIGNTRFINVYLDMVSAMTTTGAVVFEPDRLAPAVHLWRATVGWLGGLLIWVTALAVLAPLNLGGAEVTGDSARPGRTAVPLSGFRSATASDRLRRAASEMIPVYGGLTLILSVLLALSGEVPLVALMHAMSTLATSGISPVSGLEGRPGEVLAEAMIFVFFLFALSRQSFATGFDGRWVARLKEDRELRIAIFAVVVLPTLLFLRHWLAAFEVDELADASGALGALWGSVFTVLSFLSTTGFISDSWGEARSWSGLPTPGVVLIGLVLMGGGVATTAGGIKLMRVYALYKHGTRELGKLIYPNSVAGAGVLGRRLRREGAYIAWIFFMLFVLSIAAVMFGLAFAGLDFEAAMILAIAALTTTGPLAEVAGEAPILYGPLSDAAKMILAAAMILGRMEALALIALLNPAFWRA